MPAALRRRLAPLVAATFFAGVGLWIPVEKLFLAEIGFTPSTIGVMAALYAAVVPMLEVPSGILADRWSRRGVLLLGNVGLLLSALVGGASTGVTSYLAAAVLLGVFFAMQSGTLDAVAYDVVLEETGSSDRFEATLGRLRMAESVSLVLGGLGGGLLAALTSPRVTYFATVPFVLAAVGCLLAFREPRLHEVEERRPLREHLAVTVGALRSDVTLRPVVALLVLTAALSQLVFEFGPLWLVDGGAGTWTFGPTWAALMTSLGLGGALGSRLRLDAPGRLGAVVGLLAAASLVLLVTNHPAAATAAQVVLALLAVALGIVLTRRLHDAVPSAVRSGVASVVGALTWLVFIPFALGIGWAAQRWDIRTAGWALVAVVAAIAVLLPSVAGRTTAARGEPIVDCLGARSPGTPAELCWPASAPVTRLASPRNS